MEVIDIVNLPEGGAEITFELTDNEIILLVKYALKRVLIEFAEKVIEENG